MAGPWLTELLVLADELEGKHTPMSAGTIMHNDQQEDSATNKSPQINSFSGSKSPAMNGVAPDATGASGDPSAEAKLGMNGSMDGTVNPVGVTVRKGRGMQSPVLFSPWVNKAEVLISLLWISIAECWHTVVIMSHASLAFRSALLVHDMKDLHVLYV